jgi:lipopolysaccharide heptosyltransferase II
MTSFIVPKERQRFTPWRSSMPPESVLVIRMHAYGDVAITFPALVSFATKYPRTRIDYLTTQGPDSFVSSVDFINTVHSLPVCETTTQRIVAALRMGRRLRENHYDVVIDLQRNWVSRLVRILCRPRAFGEFDRFARTPAATRVLDTFHSIGFKGLALSYPVPIRHQLRSEARSTLLSKGWDGTTSLVIFNPGGFWASRNWPLENYLNLGDLWQKDGPVKFLLVGTQRIQEKARIIVQHFGEKAINLVGATTPAEAFACLQFVSCVISEDSGLMHMAWVSGIPTIALLGSSRHFWSTPLGPHTECLHSGDLECGACMEPACKYGDVHCLTRYSPEFIYEKVRALLRKESKGVPAH